jgi:putative nucleotidyltransferase with HDIG domain
MKPVPTMQRTPEQRLAAAVSARAPSIVRSALDRLGPGDRTVAAKIVATRFVERCAAATATGDWSVASDWVENACERYAGILEPQDVIGTVLDGVARALRAAADDRFMRAFERARCDVQTALARPRAIADSPNREAVDEVDIVIDGMLTRLDQTDVLTAEHSRAVGSWCARLAKRLGASKEEVIHLGRAGLIHDIGKVTTPAAILTAPRRLDEAEMAIIRQHSEAGALIVREVPLIAYLTPAVRSHHERFDGAGYPDRLKYEAIPREARIVAVADSFNAMIGRRPYRPPLAPSVALEQLVEGRGSQFDPEIVDAMILVVTNRA